nr:VOC family protein [Sphingobium subterraneum]
MEGLKEISARTGARVQESEEPGGGLIAKLIDPNGFQIDIVFGQAAKECLRVRPALTLNDGWEARRLGNLQRPDRGPSHVVRLEHCVLAGPNFDSALSFYQDVLGMKPSDEIYAGNEQETVAVFLHCGLGRTYTDHHTLALLRHPETFVDHSAFVTLDWDDLALGHDHLRDRGHLHEWGIGRHIMGSEVFDYWRDPFGFKLEHCVDGDMVNDDHRPQRAAFEESSLSIWAPRFPATFNQITRRLAS